jgi:hypothetical protein
MTEDDILYLRKEVMKRTKKLNSYLIFLLQPNSKVMFLNITHKLNDVDHDGCSLT